MTSTLLPVPMDTEAFGPKMLALTEMQQRFVLAYVISGGQALEAAACSAGYSPQSALQQAHNLLRNKRVQEAIHEEALHRLQAGALLGISVIIEIAMDPMHKDRLKAAKMLAEGTRVITPADQVVEVRHTVDEKTQVKNITALALRLGLDPHELLGQHGIIIDAEFEDVTHKAGPVAVQQQQVLPAPVEDDWTVYPSAA